MSIVTKGGDHGTTGLMYNRRVSKCDARVEAYGAVDELSAGIGLARAGASDASVREQLFSVQKDLVVLMGELATAVEDLPRYAADGYSLLTPAMTERVEEMIRQIEATRVHSGGWATPGANPTSAALDLARTICRRAERRTCALEQNRQLQNAEILIYLNRLSDLLWLLARRAEA